jgi:hypothetical protein
MSKTCLSCKEEKDLSNFGRTSDRKSGIHSQCKLCKNINNKKYYYMYLEKNREKKNIKHKEYYAKNKEKVKKHITDRERFRNYGVTKEQVELMRIAQNNCCLICNNQFIKTPHVDHIDINNKPFIRGLLCGECNLGLGKFKEDHNLLKQASNYVEQFVSMDYSI